MRIYVYSFILKIVSVSFIMKGIYLYGSEPFRTVPNRSEPFRTVPNRSEPFRTVPNRSEPFRTVPNRSKPFRTGPNWSEPVRTGPKLIFTCSSKPFGTAVLSFASHVFFDTSALVGGKRRRSLLAER